MLMKQSRTMNWPLRKGTSCECCGRANASMKPTEKSRRKTTKVSNSGGYASIARPANADLVRPKSVVIVHISQIALLVPRNFLALTPTWKFRSRYPSAIHELPQPGQCRRPETDSAVNNGNKPKGSSPTDQLELLSSKGSSNNNGSSTTSTGAGGHQELSTYAWGGGRRSCTFVDPTQFLHCAIHHHSNPITAYSYLLYHYQI